jgi:enamine deaminase RidA (YjgF/YER057c/UK114 family)
MFEVISVPGWNSRLTYAPATRAGDFVFTAGFTATDDEGQLLHEGNIVEQTRAIYRKIERILNSVGAGLDSIVETTEFFLPDPNYNKTAKVRRELFGDEFPAATGIPVQSLIRPGALIEIKVIAYVPAKGSK